MVCTSLPFSASVTKLTSNVCKVFPSGPYLWLIVVLSLEDPESSESDSSRSPAHAGFDYLSLVNTMPSGSLRHIHLRVVCVAYC